MAAGPTIRRRAALWWALESVVLSVLSLVCFVFSVLGASLVVVWLGIPVVVLTERVTRRSASHRRRIVGARLGQPVEPPYLRVPATGMLRQLTAIVEDPAVRRDVLWALVDGTVGLGLSIVALVEAVLDLIFWWLPPARAATLHAAIDHSLLSVSEKSRLAQRVEQLTESRAETVDTGAAELRRIERDLHDGAQARLVSLGMTLALAEDRLADDPDAARALLVEARGTSSAALTELRDLVRGIHPPVLADRGLSGAVQALALATPVAVVVTDELVGRLPAPVESAAYFAVAEALTNVIKHADAREVTVRLAHDTTVLTVEVHDDGHGGADLAAGTGLRGVARRLSAFDGSLQVTSPPGGPTTVAMVLPCASSSPRISPSSGTA